MQQEVNTASLMVEIDEVKKQKLEYITKLGIDIEAAQTVLNDLLKEIELKTTESQELVDIKSYVEQANKNLDKTKKDLEDSLGEHYKKKNSLEYDIENLTDLKAKKEKEVESARFDVDIDLEDKKSELVSFNKQIQAKEDQIKNLNSQVALSEQKMIEIGTLLNQKNKGVENLEVKHTALTGEINKLTGQIKSLEYVEKDLESKKIELDKITSNLEITNEQLALVEKKIKESQETHSGEMENKLKEIADKEGALSVKENSLNDKQKMLRNVKAELEKVHGKALSTIII